MRQDQKAHRGKPRDIYSLESLQMFLSKGVTAYDLHILHSMILLYYIYMYVSI